MRIATWTIASTLLLLTACGDDKNMTESATDGATTGGATTGGLTDTTIGMSSEPTTTGVEGTAEGTAEGTDATATTVDSTTTGATTTTANPTEGEEEGMTTEPPNETEGDPGIMAACMQVCVNAVECMVMRDVEACTADCSEGLGDSMGQCKKANEDFLECVGDMTCEQLIALFSEEDPGPCAQQQAAVEEECGGGDICGVSVGGNPEGTECSLQIECEGDPTLDMTCDAETCVCKIGDEMAGMCESEGICMEQGDIEEKANACCGF
jgi:hypothetical protein